MRLKAIFSYVGPDLESSLLQLKVLRNSKLNIE